MRLRFADFSLDAPARELRRGGEVVHVSPKAFDLLVLLTGASPRALSKQEILDAIWPGTFVVDSSLAGVVKELRSALGDDAKEPRFVRTVYGHGYAFSAE